jgi:hypothetical protein
VDIDPSSASRQAIEQYDKNGDANLSDQELAAVPGIAKYKSLYDQDGDGQVSQDEIAQRIRLWSEQKLAYRALNVNVTVDGRPIEGATVEFIPEEYLGPNVKPATGTTDYNGQAGLAVAKGDLPPDLAKLPMALVTGGTYKVRITHPTIDLPARFNTNTTLGEEVASDTIRERATVNLKTK